MKSVTIRDKNGKKIIKIFREKLASGGSAWVMEKRRDVDEISALIVTKDNKRITIKAKMLPIDIDKYVG